MVEQRAAARWQDPDSQTVDHVNKTGHRFKYSEATILSHAEKNLERLFKDAWLSDDNRINQYMELHPAYLVLRYQLTGKRERGTGHTPINTRWYTSGGQGRKLARAT